jgi:hypothetical protein
VADRELDVIDVLLEQHARIESLFYEVEVTSGARRRVAFDDLVRLITVHEAAEKESIHQVARHRLLGGHELIRDRLEEEREVRQMLVQLVDAGVGCPGFGTALVIVRDAVLAHIRHEERFEFPQLREHVPAERLRDLVFVVRTAEEMVVTRRGSAA